MNGRIAKVGRDGIPSIHRVNALEITRHLVESFVPTEALPTIRSAADGIFQPVFIIVEILQGNGFRADVPSTERVVLVTSYVQSVVGANSDLDSTYRFAQIACSIMRGVIGGVSHDLSAEKSRLA